MEALPGAIWVSLRDTNRRGTHITMQWIPGHAGIPGNEEADRIANQASLLPQEATPINYAGAKAAIRKQINCWREKRSRTHPHLRPTSGHNDLTRWEQCTLSQLRVGKSILCRATLHGIGLTSDPDCPKCVTVI